MWHHLAIWTSWSYFGSLWRVIVRELCSKLILYKHFRFIHGGYRTFFPYPSSWGPGSGRGVASGSTTGFSPYPTNPYYLDDLWQYNLTSGFWSLIEPVGNVKPPPRQDHIMVCMRVDAIDLSLTLSRLQREMFSYCLADIVQTIIMEIPGSSILVSHDLYLCFLTVDVSILSCPAMA